MDGSSTLHTLRWKQICAGALSAASLIAGHLVFGQDSQSLRRPGAAVAAPTTLSSPAPAQPTSAAGERLAPILNGRAKPRPAPSSPSRETSKPAGEALPPILEGKTLPKPLALGAASTKSESDAPLARANRPVATLELVPSRKTPATEKTSSVSPWMVDIDEALARKPAVGMRDAKATSEASAQPQSASKSVAPPAKAEPAKPSDGGDSFSAVRLGAPEAASASAAPINSQPSFIARAPSDLRKPSSEVGRSANAANATASPQLNPFTSPAHRETRPTAIPHSTDIGSAATPVTNSFVVSPANDSKPAYSTASEPAAPEFGAIAPPRSAVPTAPEVATRLPTVTKAANTARKPLTSSAPETKPAVPNESREPAPSVSSTRRLQLTGYEIGGQADEPPADEPVESPLLPPARAPGLQFTQAESPADPLDPLDPIEPAAEAPRPLPPGGPASPFEMIGESGTVSVMVRRSMLLRTRTDIYRTAVVDPAICDVIQFTPREVSIIGKSQGSTHVTFWFDGPNAQPITYLVKVEPDSAEVKKEEDKYKLLEDVVNEMFPDSKIQLLLVADKLIVKGQAKDSEEATQIMSIIRTNAAGGGGGGAWGPGGWNGGGGSGLSEGAAADVLSDSATGSAARARYQVINMLRVPGVQQVALRVKIAELNRTAARGFGVDVHGNVAFSDSPEGTDLFFNSILNVAGGGAPALLAQFDGDDISIGIRYLQQQGVIRLLSEPTLVTMSGRPATFVAGGEFAVPTVVGSAGLNAVTTDFRAFGAIISFLPTVVDKDRVRLEVSPEFSQINQDLAVNGTPGLRTRAVTTTVEMREGQTLAIAGLLEDNMNGTTIGDLPFLAQIFGRRSMQRAETELIILVTPELVHAMEAEEVPPLPGFDVTEPDNAQFFLHGKIEGTPTREYRSTVWPRLKNRYKADGPAMTSGPFGHGQ